MTLSEQTQYLKTFINTDLAKLQNIGEIYQELIDCITEHNRRYYLQNAPIISDFEYDQLFNFLKRIESEFPQLITSNSPTQALIWQVSEWFKKADHKTPLLSLENSYNTDDLKEFDERIQKALTKEWIYKYFYIIEPKYDWLSVELIYKDWKFRQAITRGDGYVWDDITENVKMIDNVPKTLNKKLKLLRVRGEIMMPKSVLKEINEQRELDWLDPFSNTRNAAAGSIKLLDSGEVRKRKLVCFVYDLLEAEDENWNNFEPDLKELWFSQVDLSFGKQTIWWVQEICTRSETRKELDELDYDFDGLVIKLQENKPAKVELSNEEKNQTLFTVNEWEVKDDYVSLRKILWITQHHPKWAIAYKFPAQQASTQILSVDFQVWRTWIITPVANLQPIQLSGVEISRVSLHNFDFINEKDIKLHDFVWIQRSGEVIPYITSVIKERRSWIEEKISAPLFCPACNSPIINIEIHYYCTNPECPAQTKEKLIHFCSKEAMDIQWVGDAIVDILMQQHLIHSVADIYKLSDIQTQIFLKKIPWIWEKMLYEIAQQLEESKNKELWRKLNALGIPNIWKKTAQDIEKFLQQKWAKNLTEIEEILTNEELMLQIDWIWEKTIIALKEFFANKQVKAMLEKLEWLWMNFSASSSTSSSSSWTEGEGSYVWSTQDSSSQAPQNDNKAFSITWTFQFSREMIKSEMEKNWFIFHDQPKKDTDFLLCGEKAWSKREKAETLWIKIYDSRDEIVKVFPFLWNLKVEEKKIEPQKPNQPSQMSLF